VIRLAGQKSAHAALRVASIARFCNRLHIALVGKIGFLRAARLSRFSCCNSLPHNALRQIVGAIVAIPQHALR
jgi:hypothetical protein